ncbi:unnamed protein product [marine sediment metagenome]|uniref:Uncharacterized protein n=1 Tax=marine sediment metagenome TaxID=412755 RepID=X1ELE0_9ZZZZ
MTWFSKCPQWLYSESIELSNNSIYKEKYQFIDKTFISTGHIVVHKENTKYYSILIVYPEATPYVPPTIYVLTNSVDEKIAESYAHSSPEEIEKNIAGNIHFFNRRHQNEDGSVCFIETGSPEISHQYPSITFPSSISF